ncbi:hypothetical protein FSARC_10406, partial [Fusarium sarcochroum]
MSIEKDRPDKSGLASEDNVVSPVSLTTPSKWVKDEGPGSALALFPGNFTARLGRVTSVAGIWADLQMGESGTAASAEADGSEASKKDLPPTVEIDAAGDIVLDVTFETSISTLNKTRKAELAASKKAGTQPPDRSTLKSKVRVAYRVNLAALKTHSKYFSNLLSNSQFREAKLISDIHEKLAQLKIAATEADIQDLPWIPITDDDDATKAAGRENAMEDILNIIHQRPTKTSRGTMSYVTTLAIVADRFDCVAAVARVLNTELKFKWPLTSNKPLRSEDGRPTETEQVL